MLQGDSCYCHCYLVLSLVHMMTHKMQAINYLSLSLGNSDWRSLSALWIWWLFIDCSFLMPQDYSRLFVDSILALKFLFLDLLMLTSPNFSLYFSSRASLVLMQSGNFLRFFLFLHIFFTILFFFSDLFSYKLKKNNQTKHLGTFIMFN